MLVCSLWCCPSSIKCIAQQLTNIFILYLHFIYTLQSWKKSGNDDVSKPRSLLLWTWLRHPLGTSKQYSSETARVGHFVLTCYAQVHCKSLAEDKIKAWFTKMGKTLISAPKQESLLLTNESVNEKMARNIHHMAKCFCTTPSLAWCN